MDIIDIKKELSYPKRWEPLTRYLLQGEGYCRG